MGGAWALIVITVPWLPLSRYYVQVASLALIFAVLALSWSLLRWAGQLSFGHAAFFGVGAYASGLLALRGGVPPVISVLAGGIAGVILALPIGYLCFPLKGPYFSLATLACAEALRALALNWTGLTGGSLGLVGIPALWAAASSAAQRTLAYYAVLASLGALIVVMGWVSRGNIGLGLESIRENEVAAEALGVDAFRYKLVALAISGGFTGLAGALYGHQIQYLEPGIAFGLSLSAIPMVMALFGGALTLSGPIAGALTLYLADELIFSRLFLTGHGLLYGLAIILVILRLPDGLIGRNVSS